MGPASYSEHRRFQANNFLPELLHFLTIDRLEGQYWRWMRDFAGRWLRRVNGGRSTVGLGECLRIIRVEGFTNNNLQESILAYRIRTPWICIAAPPIKQSP